jgi:hypothetical protein
MTPKEKAEELINKFFQYNYRIEWDSDKNEWVHYNESAKQCALIAVDEILSVVWINLNDDVDYWAEVKQEIEKL